MSCHVHSRLPRLLLFIGIISTIVSFNASTTHAAPNYYFRAVFGTPSCSAGPITMSAPENASVNYPAGAYTAWSVTENGTVLNSFTHDVLTTAHSGNLALAGLTSTAPWPVTVTYTLDLFVNGVQMSHSFSVISCSATGTPSVSNSFTDRSGNTTSSSSGPLFMDGRLNDSDAAQSFAVYCLGDGSVRVWIIHNSVGFLAFTASPKEIDAVPSKPVTNTLIKENLGASLYRLTSGELQVNRPEEGTGKDYHFTFKDCPKPR